jgi:hypothetical protein
VSTQRLSLTRNGRIRYQLKTPYNDGTTHVIFEPLDFIARLARSRLTFFGCFPTFTNDRFGSTPAKGNYRG